MEKRLRQKGRTTQERSARRHLLSRRAKVDERVLF
jgi:hypothetical protein